MIKRKRNENNGGAKCESEELTKKRNILLIRMKLIIYFRNIPKVLK